MCVCVCVVGEGEGLRAFFGSDGLARLPRSAGCVGSDWMASASSGETKRAAMAAISWSKRLSKKPVDQTHTFTHQKMSQKCAAVSHTIRADYDEVSLHHWKGIEVGVLHTHTPRAMSIHPSIRLEGVVAPPTFGVSPSPSLGSFGILVS